MKKIRNKNWPRCGVWSLRVCLLHIQLWHFKAKLFVLEKLTCIFALFLLQFRDKTPYSIMFGPDRCGQSSKVTCHQFICTCVHSLTHSLTQSMNYILCTNNGECIVFIQFLHEGVFLNNAWNTFLSLSPSFSPSLPLSLSLSFCSFISSSGSRIPKQEK